MIFIKKCTMIIILLNRSIKYENLSRLKQYY